MKYSIRLIEFVSLFMLSVSFSSSTGAEEAANKDDIFSQLFSTVKEHVDSTIEQNKADEAARKRQEAQQEAARLQRQNAAAEEKAKVEAEQKKAAQQNLTVTAPAIKKDDNWTESWDKAVEAARKANKPILADFTGSDWCGWCKKLDQEVFATKEFRDWAQKNVILLKLDYPKYTTQDSAIKTQNEELSKKYKIQGFPTILFLNDDGKTLGKVGYLEGGPEKWTAAADKLINK
jgi:protein disulfide-isomerase